MASPVLTLYYSNMSPWCQRIRILLKEANAEWNEVHIDRKNKPDYFKELNPLLEVPAITYGPPSGEDGQPSPDAFKLYESAVIAELISDLYPTSDIFPTDAVERAKVRFFVDFATKKLIPAVGGMIHGGALHQAVLEHVERTQTLLDPKLKFFLGDRITQADAALAPFLCYLYALVRSLVPAKEDGETAKFLSALKQDKYSTFFKYMETVVTHPTVKETFNEDGFVEQWKDTPV